MSASSQPSSSDLRLVVIIAYALFLIAMVNGITAVAGVVLAYIKRGDARGTIYEGHFANMIFVFWASLIAFVLFLAIVLGGVAGALSGWQAPHTWALLTLIPLLWFAGVAFLVWYLYRTVRGIALAVDGKAYP